MDMKLPRPNSPHSHGVEFQRRRAPGPRDRITRIATQLSIAARRLGPALCDGARRASDGAVGFPAAFPIRRGQ